MNYSLRQVRQKFTERYGAEPLMVRSPGRINLIGEHTDYNNGFVMPAAVDMEIYFAIGWAEGPSSSIVAMNFQEEIMLDAMAPRRVDGPLWLNYLSGVLDRFIASGNTVKPFRCVIGGNIPTGAGVSSSAALECGFGFALNALHGGSLSREDIMYMAQWSEHHYVGVKCGIMDQFASVMGKANMAMLLDCRSMAFEYLPFDFPGCSVLLFDSRVKHSLGSSDYNVRRRECEEGVAILQKQFPQVASLRDATPVMLEATASAMSPEVADRCSYMVAEIERVQQASRCLQQHDVEGFGKLMIETHAGLSKKYRVSCDELDFLVDTVATLPGVLGARMMGGGFGGCSINLIRQEHVDAVVEHVRKAYAEKFSIDLLVYPVHLVDGTSVVR
jgi:galactokinase